MSSNYQVRELCLPPLRDYQTPVLLSTATDDLTISAPQLGKTFTAGCWICSAAWMGGPSLEPWWWVAPTYSTCRHGFRLMTTMARTAGILKSCTTTPPLTAELVNGALIEGRSWDRPEGLYGPTIRGAVIDEFGQLTPWAYSAISSRRAETISRGEGRLRFLGNVGEIGGTAEHLWDQAVSGAAGFACRRWSWVDRALSHPCECIQGGVPPDLKTAHMHEEGCPRGIYAAFVSREAARMSEPQFRQLYGAEWADWNLLPVYTYDRKKHQDSSLRLQPELPLDLCCDFNVDPMAWTIGQHGERTSWTFDEMKLTSGATTQLACQKFIERYPNPDLVVHVYGDATGKARKTNSPETDYQIIKRMLTSHYSEVLLRIPPQNPPVVARVNAYNAMMLTAAGEIKWTHHPRCRGLSKDLARVSWKTGTREINKARGLSHFSDAEGYRQVYLFPVTGGVRLVSVGSVLTPMHDPILTKMW